MFTMSVSIQHTISSLQTKSKGYTKIILLFGECILLLFVVQLFAVISRDGR